MRYLTSISLALIVHVLLSIVVLMALACTAAPAPTATPTIMHNTLGWVDGNAVPNLTSGDAEQFFREYLANTSHGLSGTCLGIFHWLENPPVLKFNSKTGVWIATDYVGSVDGKWEVYDQKWSYDPNRLEWTIREPGTVQSIGNVC
jgi:hypothetical protein